MGKAKRRRIRRQKRKSTPPRCARQPLSREGARVDTPSFLWKEVPRRGGGWMEGSGMKESEGDRLKYAVCESTLSTAARSPFPNGEGYETGKAVSSTQSLPRVGKVASGASRIGFWRYERERGRSSQVDDIREHPSAAEKRKPTPPRCARQPLPREGARVDTPSFLWKEVPRRGGGWMGEAG